MTRVWRVGVVMVALLGAVMGVRGQDEPTPAEQLLDGVDSWFYYLAVDETLDDMVAQVVASDYEMVVIDPVVTEVYSTDYDMAGAVRAMQDSGKLVIAYIDIGQAESYRTYWQPDWRIGQPQWIVGDDPDGWVENYPVAYWYGEWQAVWFDEAEGVLPLVLALGFDGVYLDWVEAYSDENVLAIGAADGVDTVQEMIWFVEDISATLKAADPQQIVIGQNAAELHEYDDYLAAIDAIAQEQTWFDGGAETIDGDCPLPRTIDDIGSADYVAALSADCRWLHETYPDSTLSMSSEEYLGWLTAAQAKGERIFTVDYAVQPDNIAWVYETSRGYGFVPFVSNRPLNQFVPPR